MDLLGVRLAEWEEELRDAHVTNISTARADPQKAGHAAEGIWVKVATMILPPTYRVLTRKYMSTEVDVVILPPSAPAFYDEADVTDIPPAIASAVIHVKNTLDRAELRDAMQRVQSVNQDRPHYSSTSEREREGLPSAVVALGSGWKGEFDSARVAFMEMIANEFQPAHPGQIPGFVGTPDWAMHSRTIDIPAMPGPHRLEYQRTDPRWQVDHVAKLVPNVSSGPPIHCFAEWLYTACAASDPTLEPMRVALVQQFKLGGAAQILPFEASAVYSESRLR